VNYQERTTVNLELLSIRRQPAEEACEMFDELDDSEIVLSLPESHGGGAVGWDVVVWIAVTAAAVKATMQLLSFRRKNDLIAMTLGLQCLALYVFSHIQKNSTGLPTTSPTAD
jgi:hypothetical protein